MHSPLHKSTNIKVFVSIWQSMHTLIWVTIPGVLQKHRMPVPKGIGVVDGDVDPEVEPVVVTVVVPVVDKVVV